MASAFVREKVIELTPYPIAIKHLHGQRIKAGISVQSREKLPGLIDALLSAVQAGELDELLARSAKPVGGAKSRKAA